MVDIRDVRIVKFGKVLFEHFCWEIRTGENWMITGKNGSGKTTLLQLLAGSLHASQGEVKWDFVQGNTWEERYSDRKRKIKLIPTHAIHALFRDDSRFYYQQRYYASNDAGRKVRDLFGDDIGQIHALRIPRSLSIDVLLDREITRLSNGQLKKILLIQSFLHEMPRMLLLDYPFEGLDHGSRDDLSEFIDFVAAEHGVQVVLVDHGHHVPTAMNRKLTLDNFAIADETTIKKNNVAGDFQKKIAPALNLSTNTAVIEIRNLQIRYGNTVVLDNFNWIIYPGDRWALLGKNGSGKTTLFSLIFADHPMAYSQEIYLFGKRRGTGESIWDLKKRMNYLGPELVSYLNPAAIPLSAREYIISMVSSLDATKLENLVQYFRAGQWFERPVKFLSSGELQLMLMIRFFLEEKEILLLDEPFQFLDPDTKKSVCEYLQRHLRKDTTLILITHYEEDIANWTEKTKKL